MKRTLLRALVPFLFVTLNAISYAQQARVLDQIAATSDHSSVAAADAVAPISLSGNVSHLVRFSGVLNSPAKQSARLYGMTFSLYADKQGGPALWMETQNVPVDQQGHYSVLLGANTLDGAPTALFTRGSARWLGIQVEGAAEGERVALGSMPYAITAGNAELLGGQPASEFVRISTLRQELRRALLDLNNEAANGQHTTGSQAAKFNPAQPLGFVKEKPNPPEHGNQAVLAQLEVVLAELEAVNAKLNEPEPIFSFELCTEPAFQGELEGGTQVKLDGTIEARAGAEGFGNGAMVKLQGAPAARLEGKLKGAWDFLKLGICWDIGATVRNRRAAAAAPVQANLIRANLAGATVGTQAFGLVDAIAELDQDALQAKLQALADALQFNAANTVNALDTLGNMSFDGGPFAALREGGVFTELGKNLPMPPNVRTVLQNPASLLSTLQEIRDQGICNIDVPPALSGPIGQVCALIAGERFSQLLDRVDGVTGNIQSTVNTVRNRVQDVLDQLPIVGDCKLFC